VTDSSSRLGEIKARSGDEFDIIQIAKMDARWLREQLGCAWAATTIEGLLEHIEQLQAERDELDTLISEMGEELTGRAAMAAELGQLRAQRQAVVDLCDGPNRLKNRTLAASAVRAALGVSSS